MAGPQSPDTNLWELSSSDFSVGFRAALLSFSPGRDVDRTVSRPVPPLGGFW